MHFDDRLATVLRLRADGAAVRAIQFRQLLDLLGTLPSDADGDQIDAAYARLNALSGELTVMQRASLIKESALRLRSPRLVASLASGDDAVAATMIAQADLSLEQWLDLIPALSPAARRHVRLRSDLAPEVDALLSRLGVQSLALPALAAASLADTDEAEALPSAQIIQMPPPRDTDGIGAIVRRIEAFRRARESSEMQHSADSPRLPLGEDHVLNVPRQVQAFDFATDASGRVVWSDPGVAAMVLGLRLGGNEPSGSIAAPQGLDDTLRRRQPLRAVQIEVTGAPAIAGAWQVDAAPWFDPLNGSHLGWRGRMRRPTISAAPALASLPRVADSQADRIRQMLHELRTPVNAIQGFAEIIQQQLFGPAPHDYRALAATIAGDAARMLSAFEELERLAKLDSGALEIDAGETDLAAVVAATVAQLEHHTRPRGNRFEVRQDRPALPVPLAALEVERIVWRLLATMTGASAPNEHLKLRLRERSGTVRLDVSLPAVLAARSETELFSAAAGAIPQVLSAGVFGIGFALKLVAAEARAAGGKLIRKDDRLRLVLPGLASALAGHREVR